MGPGVSLRGAGLQHAEHLGLRNVQLGRVESELKRPAQLLLAYSKRFLPGPVLGDNHERRSKRGIVRVIFGDLAAEQDRIGRAGQLLHAAVEDGDGEAPGHVGTALGQRVRRLVPGPE